jgi:hypothetical protein
MSVYVYIVTDTNDGDYYSELVKVDTKYKGFLNFLKKNIDYKNYDGTLLMDLIEKYFHEKFPDDDIESDDFIKLCERFYNEFSCCGFCSESHTLVDVIFIEGEEIENIA